LFNGEKGARGINTFIKKNGLCINLGSKAEIDVEPGDRFLLQTPG
jgi:5-oxoprolinase (ATP-hydrolysing)